MTLNIMGLRPCFSIPAEKTEYRSPGSTLANASAI